jgi:hypothetical protein
MKRWRDLGWVYGNLGIVSSGPLPSKKEIPRLGSPAFSFSLYDPASRLQCHCQAISVFPRQMTHQSMPNRDPQQLVELLPKTNRFEWLLPVISVESARFAATPISRNAGTVGSEGSYVKRRIPESRKIALPFAAEPPSAGSRRLGSRWPRPSHQSITRQRLLVQCQLLQMQ